VYWDFDFAEGSSQPRDSSASAIAACAFLQLGSNRYHEAGRRVGSHSCTRAYVQGRAGRGGSIWILAMPMLRTSLALISNGLLFAVLARGQVNQVGEARPKPAISRVTPVVATEKPIIAQRWSYQIDEATFSRGANAWADQQPPLQTPLGNVRLRNLSATLRDNQMVIGGDADAGWIVQPVSVNATADIVSGRLVVQVRQATVGAVLLPEATRRLVEHQAQQELDDLVAAQHAVVDSVRIADGSLVLSGTRSGSTAK
jgi:hypothetical protein